MPKFRRKPIVIEATQWWPGSSDVECVESTPHGAVILTPEGTLEVLPGDWIITGVNGDKYTCCPEAFAEMFEPASD